MKHRLPLIVALLTIGFSANAQKKDGGISKQMLQEILQSQTMLPQDKALFNALASNKIDDLAKNFEHQNLLDTHFSVETPSQSITDQKSSGRCWMFSGLNVLRSNFTSRKDSLLGFVPAKSNVQLEFSQDYLFIYDQLEKANLFLQGVIDHGKKPIDDQRVQFFFKSPIGDGGTFCGVADLTEKYGLVPKAKSKLREQGLQLREMVQAGKSAKEINKAKTEALGVIYKMITMNLGKPVKEFTYTFRDKDGKAIGQPKTYTPQSFYKAVVGEPLNGSFIMVMNDPRREYYKTYEVEYDRHTYDGNNWVYLNLPMDDIEKLAIASLKDGRKLYSSYDVGKQLDRPRLFNTTFSMDKAQRISTFDSGSTHAMTLTAVDLDANGKATKWKVENSWGATWGQRGCLIMTDRWFREYMFRLVVDKKYVSADMLKMAAQKPIMVMPEDPLFQVDE